MDAAADGKTKQLWALHPHGCCHATVPRSPLPFPQGQELALTPINAPAVGATPSRPYVVCASSHRLQVYPVVEVPCYVRSL